MTQAEVLQSQIMSDFFSNLFSVFENDTDKELTKKLWDAQEEQDGKKIKAIREEYNRRRREE